MLKKNISFVNSNIKQNTSNGMVWNLFLQTEYIKFLFQHVAGHIEGLRQKGNVLRYKYWNRKKALMAWPQL